MTSKLWASAAVGALVAALGASSLALADVPTGEHAQGPSLDTAPVVNDDNGVRAAPSGHVSVEVIMSRPGRFADPGAHPAPA